MIGSIRKDLLYSHLRNHDRDYYSYANFRDGGFVDDLIGRNSKYGKCANCNKDNTNAAWCLSCDPYTITQWTSRNKDIDDFMKKFQLRTFAYEDTIEWISFDRLNNIIKIGEGGFGFIFKATWLDGIRKIEKNNNDSNGGDYDDNYSYQRSRESNSIVALKSLSGSKTTVDFLNEFKNHMKCKLYGSKLQIYGLTHNPKVNEYFMVFQYADDGNIYKFLQSNLNRLTWEFKLKQLRDISKDLDQIHEAEYIHADFHSGNILHNKGNSYVSDLGLSKKADENNTKGVIFGVMPYVAPEVLSGKQQFTKKADIYGFGVIMAEMTTGQRPFDGYKFDTNLAIEICNGLRPKFAPGTPDCYIEFANKCMSSDPDERPDAFDIYKQIQDWLEILASDNESEIKNQFLNADEIIKTLQIIPQNHPDHMYTSKIINTQKISNAIKDSTLMDLHISDSIENSDTI